MNRILQIFPILLTFTIGLSAQQAPNFWTLVQDREMPEDLVPTVMPQTYATYQLDVEGFKNALRQAPYEDLMNSQLQGQVLLLPMPDGTFNRFNFVETSVFHPNTAANYPNIRSYRGNNLDRSGSLTRIAVSSMGIHAAIQTIDGTILTAPFDKENPDYYMTYEMGDLIQPEQAHQCGFDESLLEPLEAVGTHPAADLRDAQGDPVEMRQFRMALAASGEFSQGHGGTVETVLEAFNIIMNRLNLTYEQTLATRFVLVDGIESVIYLDPMTDPYTTGNNGGSMLYENFLTMNIEIGFENFDIAQVMTGPCTDVAGVVSGRICDSDKAQGVTCHYSDLISVTSNTMAHEVGHQLSAGHTWNACPPYEQQYASSSAWEPGSGSTIMSYSGACGPANNVPKIGDPYFHGGTIDQMNSFIRSNASLANCGENLPTDNNFPEVTLDLADGFYIPISTPFELEATATDVNGDMLTYCWEQRDLGPYGELGSPQLNAPLFRSFPPTVDSNRIFPSIGSLVANSFSNRELLPTYSRALNFSCTVRDNNATIGGVAQAYIGFNATDAAGPFVVTSPNATEAFTMGEFHVVTWEVSHTDQAPVNCSTVNISMSTDGGYTYPIELANGVANDGSYGIVMPDIETTTARIRVKAADNIFFDISNVNFSIEPPTTPDFSLALSNLDAMFCPPNEIVIELSSTAQLDFANDISFAIDVLPIGANAVFVPETIAPGESSTLTITTEGLTVFATDNFDIVAMADGVVDKFYSIDYISADTDFSAFALTTPTNGLTAVATVSGYSWADVPNADYYDIQIAAHPSFDDASIVESATNITDGFFSPTVQLEKNKPYYWRVRPVTLCGPGPYETFAFHTEVQSCTSYESADLPMEISSSGLDEVTSVIAVAEQGTVDDVNITDFEGNHDRVRHIKAEIISPSGTVVELFNDEPCGSTNFDLRFDDEALMGFPCPSTSFVPVQVSDPAGLAAFNGENLEGDWLARITVIDNFGNGGDFEHWGFEICGSIAVNPPVLITNEPLDLPTGATDYLFDGLLYSEDAETGADGLTYTIIELPEKGILSRGGAPLEVGGTFTQNDINSFAIGYQHLGTTETTDHFVFTISDGEGGWFGTPQFTIIIDEEATVSTDDLMEDHRFRLFPNPTAQDVNLVVEKDLEEVQLAIFNIQGQKMMDRPIARLPAGAPVTVDVSAFSNGLYFVELNTPSGRFVEKLTIQR